MKKNKFVKSNGVVILTKDDYDAVIKENAALKEKQKQWKKHYDKFIHNIIFALVLESDGKRVQKGIMMSRIEERYGSEVSNIITKIYEDHINFVDKLIESIEMGR